MVNSIFSSTSNRPIIWCTRCTCINMTETSKIINIMFERVWLLPTATADHQHRKLNSKQRKVDLNYRIIITGLLELAKGQSTQCVWGKCLKLITYSCRRTANHVQDVFRQCREVMENSMYWNENASVRTLQYTELLVLIAQFIFRTLKWEHVKIGVDVEVQKTICMYTVKLSY